MRITRSVLGIAAMAAAMAIGVVGGTASAAAPRQAQTPGTGQAPTSHPVSVIGRVTSVSGSGLVLQTPRGNLNVNASANTWIVVESSGQCVEGNLQDIQTAKPALVMGMGTAAANATIDARVIAQGPCRRAAENGVPPMGKAAAQLAQHLAQGTVKSINGSVLTVTLDKRKLDITLNTTADTVVLNNGFKGVNSIRVGDKVQMFGRLEKPAKGAQTATATAWGIRVVSAGEQLAVGRVTAVNGNTLTLRTPKNGAITVTLDASTGYKSLTVANGTPSLSNATQSAVVVGTNLIVEGAGSDGSKTLAAKAVIVLPSAKAKTTK